MANLLRLSIFVTNNNSLFTCEANSLLINFSCWLINVKAPYFFKIYC